MTSFERFVTPTRGRECSRPWEGLLEKKPWDYQVTAVIPVMDTPGCLDMVIPLLQAQTERPYIVLIDTGSVGSYLERIQEMRSEDIEVHSLCLHGVRHPSDYPAIAMDLAMSLCRTPYLFCTHADVFPMRRDLLADLVTLCRDKSPAVGYEITPRAHDDWHGMVSHTCTMLEMKAMDRIGAGWSLRRLANSFGIEDHSPDPRRPNWPDTELLLNYLLREAGIAPHLIGKEENFKRTVDQNIDHCRSFTGSMLYHSRHYEAASAWVEDAIGQARVRLRRWHFEERSEG